MSLNERRGRGSATRRRTVDELLDELTSWNPRERMGAFRSWLEGSLSLIHLHVLTLLEADGPLSMCQARRRARRLGRQRDRDRRSDGGSAASSSAGTTQDDRRVSSSTRRRPATRSSGRSREQRRERLERLLDRLTDDELDGASSAPGHARARSARRVRVAAEPRAASDGHAPRRPATDDRPPPDLPPAVPRRSSLVVIGLLLVQAIGNLYLPDLNGDIINNGVVKGDIDYILRVGGLMLLITALVGVAAIASVYLSSRDRQRLRPRRPQRGLQRRSRRSARSRSTSSGRRR